VTLLQAILQPVLFQISTPKQKSRANDLQSANKFSNKKHACAKNLIFTTLANTNVHFEDIVHGLTTRKCAVLCRKDGSLCLPVSLGETMPVKMCVGGGTVQQGHNPEEHEQD